MSRDAAGDGKGRKLRKDSSRMEQQRQERERFRQEILHHVRNLAEEMNLRLLLDGEPNPVGEDDVLFVESITVTGIAYPVNRRKSYWGRMRSSMKKAFTYIHRLLWPKCKSTGDHAPQQLR